MIRWMRVQIFTKEEACKAEHANSACHWCGLPRILLRDGRWIWAPEGKDHQGRPHKTSMWTRFVNQRDLVWSMPLTRMVGRVVREGASLSKAPQWTGCKRCAELDNCNWFNYEGTRCRLFQCRGNTWGRTTNSYAGPKWKLPSFCPKYLYPQVLRLVSGRSRWEGVALWWWRAKQRCLIFPYFATYRLPCPICGINLGNCRLCIMALPAVIHQYLTSASSISLDFWYSVNLLN